MPRGGPQGQWHTDACGWWPQPHSLRSALRTFPQYPELLCIHFLLPLLLLLLLLHTDFYKWFTESRVLSSALCPDYLILFPSFFQIAAGAGRLHNQPTPTKLSWRSEDLNPGGLGEERELGPSHGAFLPTRQEWNDYKWWGSDREREPHALAPQPTSRQISGTEGGEGSHWVPGARWLWAELPRRAGSFSLSTEGRQVPSRTLSTLSHIWPVAPEKERIGKEKS